MNPKLDRMAQKADAYVFTAYRIHSKPHTHAVTKLDSMKQDTFIEQIPTYTLNPNNLRSPLKRGAELPCRPTYYPSCVAQSSRHPFRLASR